MSAQPAVFFKERVAARADGLLPQALELSHGMSDNPELAFAEFFAASQLVEFLSDHGFAVRRPVAGLDTAFAATAGGDGLHIGLFAELDALPDIGHACGHNVISAAAVLTATALQPFLAELGIRLTVFGTPAEEGGGGKVIMLEAGAFDDLDIAMMVHPAPHDLAEPAILAMTEVHVEITGFTPPSMNPERGRSAADAVTLTQTGVGLLRQHLRATDRMSGYIVNEGFAANVLPATAELRYILRSASLQELQDLRTRFEAVVTGAALATGTEARVMAPHPDYDALRHDAVLGSSYAANVQLLGREFPDVSDANAARSASTDFGNISQRVRAIHPLIGVAAHGYSNHQREFAQACRGPAGDAAVRDGAIALAWTVIDASMESR